MKLSFGLFAEDICGSSVPTWLGSGMMLCLFPKRGRTFPGKTGTWISVWQRNMACGLHQSQQNYCLHQPWLQHWYEPWNGSYSGSSAWHSCSTLLIPGEPVWDQEYAESKDNHKNSNSIWRFIQTRQKGQWVDQRLIRHYQGPKDFHIGLPRHSPTGISCRKDLSFQMFTLERNLKGWKLEWKS